VDQIVDLGLERISPALRAIGEFSCGIECSQSSVALGARGSEEHAGSKVGHSSSCGDLIASTDSESDDNRQLEVAPADECADGETHTQDELSDEESDDEHSDDDSSDETVGILLAVHRRTDRVVRSASEKTKEWQRLRRPSFEHWGYECSLLQEARPVPHHLTSHDEECMSLRQSFLSQKGTILTRSLSHDVARTRYGEDPEVLVGSKDDEGDVRVFISFQEGSGGCLKRTSDLAVAPRAADSAQKKRANVFNINRSLQLLAQKNMARRRLISRCSEDGIDAQLKQSSQDNATLIDETHTDASDQNGGILMAWYQIKRQFDHRYAEDLDLLQQTTCFRRPRRHTVAGVQGLFDVVRC